MMNVLIKGEYSYIGNAVAEWLNAKSTFQIIKQLSSNQLFAKIKWNNIEEVFYDICISQVCLQKYSNKQ
jgi:UDP-glucose 4-epimerase